MAADFVRAWFAQPAPPPTTFLGLHEVTSDQFLRDLGPTADDFAGTLVFSLIQPTPTSTLEDFGNEVKAEATALSDSALGYAAGVYDGLMLIALALERAGVTRGPALPSAFVESSRSGSYVGGPLDMGETLFHVRSSQDIDYDGAVDDLDFGPRRLSARHGGSRCSSWTPTRVGPS